MFSVEQVVFCKLTSLQSDLYKKLIGSKAAVKALATSSNGGISLSSLAAVTSLKKLCNR